MLWNSVSKETAIQPDDIWKNQDGQARAMIGLVDEQLNHIRDAKTAKQMWDAF